MLLEPVWLARAVTKKKTPYISGKASSGNTPPPSSSFPLTTATTHYHLHGPSVTSTHAHIHTAQGGRRDPRLTYEYGPTPVRVYRVKKVMRSGPGGCSPCVRSIPGPLSGLRWASKGRSDRRTRRCGVTTGERSWEAERRSPPSNAGAKRGVSIGFRSVLRPGRAHGHLGWRGCIGSISSSAGWIMFTGRALCISAGGRGRSPRNAVQFMLTKPRKGQGS